MAVVDVRGGLDGLFHSWMSSGNWLPGRYMWPGLDKALWPLG